MNMGNSIQDDYMFSREFRDSSRLHVQHLMWNMRLGWLLHPSIPIPSSAHADSYKIADIGIGNGDWRIELAAQTPPQIQLHGFDVSTTLFPAKEYLPENVELHELDAFGKLPEDLKAKFDVVHVRAFTIVVKEGHPRGLLDNMIAMLKPGGYLQWDEMDSASFSSHAPNAFTPKTDMDDLLKRFQEFCSRMDLKFEWISRLSDIFTEQNLAVVENFRLPINDPLRHMSTDNFLMGLDDLGYVIPEEILGPREKYREAFNKAVQEARRGVTISMDMVVVVGKLEEKLT